jgi:hypothetical protein
MAVGCGLAVEDISAAAVGAIAAFGCVGAALVAGGRVGEGDGPAGSAPGPHAANSIRKRSSDVLRRMSTFLTAFNP